MTQMARARKKISRRAPTRDPARPRKKIGRRGWTSEGRKKFAGGTSRTDRAQEKNSGRQGERVCGKRTDETAKKFWMPHREKPVRTGQFRSQASSSAELGGRREAKSSPERTIQDISGLPPRQAGATDKKGLAKHGLKSTQKYSFRLTKARSDGLRHCQNVGEVTTAGSSIHFLKSAATDRSRTEISPDADKSRQNPTAWTDGANNLNQSE